MKDAMGRYSEVEPWATPIFRQAPGLWPAKVMAWAGFFDGNSGDIH